MPLISNIRIPVLSAYMDNHGVESGDLRAGGGFVVKPLPESMEREFLQWSLIWDGSLLMVLSYP